MIQIQIRELKLIRNPNKILIQTDKQIEYVILAFRMTMIKI